VSMFKWYRKIRGGFWVCSPTGDLGFTKGWKKVDRGMFMSYCLYKLGKTGWDFEEYN
jgi:hypothetical protein